MTNPVIPPEVVQASPWPALGSANYNQDSYAAGASQPAAFARQGEIAAAGYTNAVSAKESATAATQAATSAADAGSIALSAANFKGLWTSLAGALARPASVKHNGRFWLLLQDLPNVAAAEPGVSAAWTSVQAGTITQRVTAAGTVNALAGVTYIVAIAGVTLSMPAAPLAGDRIAWSALVPFNLAWSGNTLKGETPQVPMTVPKFAANAATFDGVTWA